MGIAADKLAIRVEADNRFDYTDGDVITRYSDIDGDDKIICSGTVDGSARGIA